MTSCSQRSKLEDHNPGCVSQRELKCFQQVSEISCYWLKVFEMICTGSCSGRRSSCCWEKSRQRSSGSCCSNRFWRVQWRPYCSLLVLYHSVRAHKSTADTHTRTHIHDMFLSRDSGLLTTHTFICMYMQSVGNVYSMHTDTRNIYSTHTVTVCAYCAHNAHSSA